MVEKADLARLRSKLKKANYDFIIIDTSPGFYGELEMAYWDEVLLITTPDTPSATGIMRLNALAKRTKINRSITLNKVRKKRYELQPDEIEDAIGERITAVMPYDELVDISMAEKIPAYLLNHNSPYSKSIDTLARAYAKRRKPGKA